MKLNIQTPNLDPFMRKVVGMIKNKLAFVKVWANASAQEGRETARRKPGRRWWRDLARSVQVRTVSESAAEVSSNQVGASLKQYGGTVRPKRAKALTIPIAPEAKGKTAYEMNTPSQPLFRPKGTSFLARANKDGTLKPLFALVAKADQQPDPWFPSNARLAAIGRREAEIMFKKEQAAWNTP